ncbi:uncharacterized protein ARMOST_13988 [Armillaria ostoyae]|uniref:Uncharacterized protein n=1 Tax=Armillaria ostoyae TaxID=47428 RepID=A0A284RPE2_ARMOS|nr:uncharacterized protein ARMOST_13988 [Armillaria ostoyae]
MIPNHSDTSIDASSTSNANVLSVFLGLISNRDPVIIFFAGNGSDYLLSDHDDPDDEDDVTMCSTKFVEAFCTIDRDSLSNGIPIPDISDRSLNTMSLVLRKGIKLPSFETTVTRAVPRHHSNIELRDSGHYHTRACLA